MKPHAEAKVKNMKIPSRWRIGLIIAFLFCSPRMLAAQIRTIYVIPSSHWDRGFLTSPEEILPRLKPHIDEVIEDAAADPQFRWTIESIWQLNEWLERTHDPKRIQELRDLVKNGQIEVSGVYGSMHTEFMGPEELNLIAQDGFRMARRLGIATPDLAMMDDVPGFTRWLPQVLAKSQVHYFLNGSNLFIGGGTSLAPGHVPFYWEAPDGSKVLTWVSEGKEGGYTEGMVKYYLAPEAPDPYAPDHLMIPKKLWGKPPLEVMQIGIDKLLKRYQDAGYKYDAVLVMFMHDFVSPSLEKDYLLPAVRKWNASGRTPKIRVATPKEFFTHILSKYAREIPTYQGDWTGLWSEVKTNSPGISALAREDQMALRANGLLWGALQLQGEAGFPSGNLHQDYRRLWNYDEHSGAGQTGWANIMTVREVNGQNREYVDYVRDALDDQKFLLETGIRKMAARLVHNPAAASGEATGPLLAVYHPQSWTSTEPVRIPQFPKAQEAAAFKDLASGKSFPVQWTGTGGVMTAPLPAAGVALFAPVKSEEGATTSTANPANLTLENRYYHVELRRSDGSIARILDRESGREIVNTSARDGFNQLIRSVGLQRAPKQAGPITFRVSQGPVFDSIVVLRPGSYEPETEYRLFHAFKRLEIRDLLDWSRMPVVTTADHVNTYQFTFPFLAGETIQSFHYESGFGMTEFPQDYLPGARMDAVVSHGLVFSAGDFHVAISSPQAFYWNVPGGKKSGWQLWENEIISSVWRKNDLGETRDYGNYLFPTLEPGLSGRQWFAYELESWNAPWDAADAYRRIWDAVLRPNVEPLPRGTEGSVKATDASLFSTDQPDVIVIAAEASLTHAGAVVVRLQNLSGVKHSVRLQLPAEGLEAAEVNLNETPVGSGRLQVNGRSVALEVSPHAAASILVSRPSK